MRPPRGRRAFSALDEKRELERTRQPDAAGRSGGRRTRSTRSPFHFLAVSPRRQVPADRRAADVPGQGSRPPRPRDTPGLVADGHAESDGRSRASRTAPTCGSRTPPSRSSPTRTARPGPSRTGSPAASAPEPSDITVTSSSGATTTRWTPSPRRSTRRSLRARSARRTPRAVGGAPRELRAEHEGLVPDPRDLPQRQARHGADHGHHHRLGADRARDQVA